jgi:sulfopyruvate decarboxylase TPP-binding subunit
MSEVEMLTTDSPWAPILHDALVAADVRQVTYVPDAGHARLIGLLRDSPAIAATVLTTEEEGVAIAAGAWAGGQRAALLMQSSGVGNCVNMLSMIGNCRMPFFAIVTMRGEFAEFNPWQVPMGRATEPAFQIMGVRPIRVDRLEDLEEQAASALAMAFDGDQAVALILSQRLLGAKKWLKQ